MTPFEAEQVNQEQIEQREFAQIEWESEGAADAAFGVLPRYVDEAYLAGYVRATKELPTKPDGTIDRRTSPMYEYGHGGDRFRGVNPGDCNWLYGNQEEF
jgi:hypothetical protein